jgi:hypothetical protein
MTNIEQTKLAFERIFPTINDIVNSFSKSNYAYTDFGNIFNNDDDLLDYTVTYLEEIGYRAEVDEFNPNYFTVVIYRY